MEQIVKDKYIGTLLDGRYQITELIGEGGMAVVYKAMCNRLNRYVAVKIMRDEFTTDPELKKRFSIESQAVAMLSHPNIVSVYDVSHNEDVEFIVMELIEGISLKQYLEKKGKIGWKETLHFSKQIAKALSHAHNRGIIHRDIKPQNIMLLRDGTIKVADFGIAALESEAIDNKGQAVGSIHYISPEQARGESPNVGSDIYSLGVVMYEMLTGRLPFTGNTLSEVAIKHMEAKLLLPHEISDDFPLAFESIVLKAMNPSVEERYKSAAELLDALEIFTEQQNKLVNENTQTHSVHPVRSLSELPLRKFTVRRKRSRRVSFYSGTFFTFIIVILLFYALWNFWLKEIFSESDSVIIPDFKGQNISAVLSNSDYLSLYNFSVNYVSDGNQSDGTVISQSPTGGSEVISNDGIINVNLNVYSEPEYIRIPNLMNYSFEDALSVLESYDLIIEIENVISDNKDDGYVIRTTPTFDENVAPGTVFTLGVGCGESIDMIDMPMLVGLTEESAAAKVLSCGLYYGGASYINDETQKGIVISQEIEAYTKIEERTKVVITVSSGLQEDNY